VGVLMRRDLEDMPRTADFYSWKRKTEERGLLLRDQLSLFSPLSRDLT